jgi:murein DD-endopeptidase MepM/ murein hydrolase activator NlpD
MPFPEKTITGEYGTLSAYRRKMKMQPHSGTDWAPPGSNRGKTLIPAIADGTIRLVQWSAVLGWVVVQTAASKDGKIWFIGYCHLACKKCGINCKGAHGPEIALSVKVGDKVTAGDVSHGMTIGNTGNASSGAHLHATLGKAVKDVFGPTTAKSDLKKAILANGGGAVAPKVDKKTAKAIIKGEAPKAAPKEEPVKPLVADESKELTVEDWKKFQQILNRNHGYAGAIDGNPGKQTWMAIQRSIQTHGYGGAVDGVPGPNTYKGVQRRLVARADYEGRIDGTWGPQTIAALRKTINDNKY